MKPVIPLCGACRHFQPTKEKWLGDCMKQRSAHLASDKACKSFASEENPITQGAQYQREVRARR